MLADKNVAELIEALKAKPAKWFDTHEYDWPFWRRPSQAAPEGAWQLWLIMAGRGYGKTRAGAEWVRSLAEADPSVRIALVAANPAEARSIMVEGDSGLLAIAPPELRPTFEPSLKRLVWPNGAEAALFGASDPESLRGPQHSHAWADEVGKWDHGGMAAWDNLMLTLRQGDAPRVAATTTPRASVLMRRLMSQAGAAVTQGSTIANRAHLAPTWIGAMTRLYGGTRLGRQELDGDMIADVDGALWTRAMIDAARARGMGGGGGANLVRVVVGVDPPASATGDACGIIVAGIDADGLCLVLADASVEKASPERWARAVAAAAHLWQADRVIAEANNGGDMVSATLRTIDPALPVRMVHARRGKSARAEPVAALYESGRVAHAGMFAALDDQLCGMLVGGGYAGPGRSPDRADALVWAVTALVEGIGRGGEGARVRVV
ncbi:MAG: hypothetical protein RLZZ58_155 [Pseudomonadota bacterium]